MNKPINTHKLLLKNEVDKITIDYVDIKVGTYMWFIKDNTVYNTYHTILATLTKDIKNTLE